MKKSRHDLITGSSSITSTKFKDFWTTLIFLIVCKQLSIVIKPYQLNWCPTKRAYKAPLICTYQLLVLRMRLLLVTTFQDCFKFEARKILQNIIQTTLGYLSILCIISMTDLPRRVQKVPHFFPPREEQIQPGQAVTAQKKAYGISNAWRPRTKLVVSGILATHVATANRGPKIGRWIDV